MTRLRWSETTEGEAPNQVTQHTTTCGAFRVDNNLNRPPLVPESKWFPWTLYQRRRGEFREASHHHSVPIAKRAAAALLAAALLCACGVSRSPSSGVHSEAGPETAEGGVDRADGQRIDRVSLLPVRDGGTELGTDAAGPEIEPAVDAAVDQLDAAFDAEVDAAGAIDATTGDAGCEVNECGGCGLCPTGYESYDSCDLGASCYPCPDGCSATTNILARSFRCGSGQTSGSVVCGACKCAD